MGYLVSLHTDVPTIGNEVQYPGYERQRWDGVTVEPFSFPQCEVGIDVIVKFYALWLDGYLVDNGQFFPRFQLGKLVTPSVTMVPRIEDRSDSKDAGDSQEIARLRAVIERDRTEVAEALRGIKLVLESRQNQRDPGRGDDVWNDERYQAEVISFYGSIRQHLNSLSAITNWWADTPVDAAALAKARATKVPLLEKAADALKTLIGHDSDANLRHKYGEKWWVPINILEQNLRTASAQLARNGGIEEEASNDQTDKG